MKRYISIFLLSAFFSCQKEKENPVVFPALESGQMVLVCSEGNFRWGNAEAGLLNLRTGQSSWKAFREKNQRPLGDVLHSAAFWNGKLWLVVNNSGRLEGLNPESFEVKESITGLTSPRFLQAVSSEKAYVTDLYANAVWILKSGNSQPAGSIPMSGWTEEMLLTGNRLWVVCREQPYLIGINTQNDKIEDTLFLPGKARSISAGPEGKIWVSFEEGFESGPGIRLINPVNQEIEEYWYDENNSAVPDRLHSSLKGDSLFFLHKGLCSFSKGHFFRYPLESGNWYGLGLDPLRNQIWLSDVKDYQQESRILRLDYSGKKIQEWNGGIISSRFYFW